MPVHHDIVANAEDQMKSQCSWTRIGPQTTRSLQGALHSRSKNYFEVVMNSLDSLTEEGHDHEMRVSDQRDVMKVLCISQQLLQGAVDASESKAVTSACYDMQNATHMAHKLLRTLPDAPVLERLGSKVTREVGSYARLCLGVTERLALSTVAECMVAETFVQVRMFTSLSIHG
jgi:hypothetical protein